MSYEFPKDKPVTPGQDIPEKDPSPGQEYPPADNPDNPVPDNPMSCSACPANKLEQFVE